MNTFELRWLNRPTGRRLMDDHGFYYDEEEKTLQYRVKELVTFYATSSCIDTPQQASYYSWSEWMNVPIIDA